MDLVLRVGSSFFPDPTPNTSPEPHLQIMLPRGHPCHTWDLELGTPCEVVSPNFHALISEDCMDWAQVTSDLGLGTPCKAVPRLLGAREPCCMYGNVLGILRFLSTSILVCMFDKFYLTFNLNPKCQVMISKWNKSECQSSFTFYY